jgi:hypothetical protein
MRTRHGWAKRGGKAAAGSRVMVVKTRRRLAFGELETLARALLTVLLSLMFARIARQKTELLELTAQFGVELE